MSVVILTLFTNACQILTICDKEKSFIFHKNHFALIIKYIQRVNQFMTVVYFGNLI